MGLDICELNHMSVRDYVS